MSNMHAYGCAPPHLGWQPPLMYIPFLPCHLFPIAAAPPIHCSPRLATNALVYDACALTAGTAFPPLTVPSTFSIQHHVCTPAQLRPSIICEEAQSQQCSYSALYACDNITTT